MLDGHQLDRADFMRLVNKFERRQRHPIQYLSSSRHVVDYTMNHRKKSIPFPTCHSQHRPSAHAPRHVMVYAFSSPLELAGSHRR